MKSLVSLISIVWVLSYPLAGIAATPDDAHGHQRKDVNKKEAPMQAHDEHAHEEHAQEEDGNGHKDAGKSESHAEAENGQGEHAHDEHEAAGISLTDEKKRLGDIAVTRLEQHTLQQEIIVPGEVKANRYATSILSPRINAQVLKRHARLGELVKKSAPLVTLSSVEMAEAQGDLIIANLEWLRMKKLGRSVVSEKRYIQARIAQQQALAKVVAYGMTTQQVDRLLKEGDVAGATGQFDLLAAQAGTVIKDDFIVGEIIEPGRVLFEITDETRLWVEARARPEDATQIVTGTQAKIKSQNSWFEGKVIQVQHVIDEETRTLPVRLEVKDRNHSLHPGQFVEVRLQLTTQSAVMAVPKAAALRNAEGEWIVFVEDKPGSYKSIDINTIRTVGDQLIVEGLSPGMRVVTKGAFFLQSEMAKSGFDVHNH